MMKFLCVFVLCTVGVTGVSFGNREEKEAESSLMRLLKELLEVNEAEKENEETDVASAKIGLLNRKKSLAKRGSYCFPDEDCVFPFLYNGVEHNTCTIADADYHWCSHAANYSSIEGYSKCGCLGCEPSSLCVFPFTYKGVTYSECTDADHDQAWCSHNKEYVDGSGTYSNCNCLNCLSPPECTFPFEYNGQQYDECTTDGASDGKYWCSKTAVYSWYGGFAECSCFGEL